MPPQRIAAVTAALLAIFAVAAPLAVAQEYTTPTTPEYQAPDEDAGAAPDDDAGDTPADDAAPDTGTGAPAPAGTLPVTGSELPAFLTVLGLVLLLSGFAVRRGMRPLG